MRKIKYSRLFILGVLVYILFKGLILLIGLKTPVLILEDDFYTMKTKKKVMVIRDEYLIKSDTNGRLSLLVNENEKIQKLQKVATIYNKRIDENINKEIYDLQQEIKDIEKNNNSLQRGIILLKKEQLKILEEQVKSNTTNCYVDTPGIISFKYDNNENKYNSDSLSTLTREDIERSTNNYTSASIDNKMIKTGDIILRVIDNNHIYIAFISEDNELFNQGDSVKIGIKNDVINGEIYAKYKKSDYFITIVKISQQNAEIYNTRESKFDIIYNQIEALRIPKESIVRKNNKKGVYVINEENKEPEFIEIKGISFEDDNYLYVDFRSNEVKGINTIKLHDRIILKPNFINKKIAKIN